MYIQNIRVSTTIRVSESTKEKLGRLKRADESWNEFLGRLVAEEDPIETGAWSDEQARASQEYVREHRQRTS